MRRPRSVTVGLAAGGVVAGHALAYVLAYPVAQLRALHLRETGHQEFSLVLLVGLATAGAALVITFARAARRDATAPAFGTLLALQVALFLGMEAAERGFDLPRIVADPAVVVGVGLQVLLAVVLVLLARGAAAAGRRLGHATRRRASSGVAPMSPRKTADPIRPDPLALGPRRAPPSPAAA